MTDTYFPILDGGRSLVSEMQEGQALPASKFDEIVRYLEQLASGVVVKDKDLTAPPGSPADGDAYIVAGSATGAWSGHDGKVAFRMSTSWNFIIPREGTTAYVQDENARYLYGGASWALDTTGGGIVVLNELPSGSINGSNTAFTLANTPTAAGVRLYLNGIRQQPGSGKDYTLSGGTITMAVAPSSGDILLCDYQH